MNSGTETTTIKQQKNKSDYERTSKQQSKTSSRQCPHHLCKDRLGYYSMRDAVNNYLESCSANRPAIGSEETILAHRKIAANRLAIDCIYALSKEELSKVDRVLEGIACNVPRQECGIRR